MANQYTKIYKELIETIGGKEAESAMEVLKKNNVLSGSLDENVEWGFNFMNGGWNSVTAMSRKEAIKKINAEYKGKGQHLVPDLKTVRILSRSESERLYRMFD